MKSQQRRRARRTTGCCSPRARSRSCCRFPARPAGRHHVPRSRGRRRDARSARGRGRRAVVIGGGLLGLEAANGLLTRGMEVTVVHLLRHADGAPARRGGRRAAARFAREPRNPVQDARADRRAHRRRTRATAVRFEDGSEIAADLVVMAVGVRPNIDARARRRAALRPGRARRRHDADVRPEHLRGGRVRSAP